MISSLAGGARRPLSPGAVFRAAVLAAAFVAAPAVKARAQTFSAALVSEDVIPRGAVWRYFRGVAEPSGGSLAWTERGFADGGWQSGSAGFGYADGDDATNLADMRGRYSTVYLRRTFQVDDPGQVDDLELAINFDDGFIAFINGEEVARANAGAAGVYPAFNGVATAVHDAGTFVAFRVADAGALLVPGANVLAVVGLNQRLDSSDFSLHPELRGAVVVAGCDGDFYAGGGKLKVAGTAPVPATAAVEVNGQNADLDPLTGAWSYNAQLAGGSLNLAVEALNGSGGVIASRTLNAIRVRVLAGEIETDTTLRAADSPHLVAGEVSLPAGRQLRIEAGCAILLRPGAGFSIQGEVQALGTAAAPIIFTRVPCNENWGHIEFDDALGASRFTSCEWSWGTGGRGCITATDSDLEFESCTFQDIDGEGIHATGGRTRVRRCEATRTMEAFSIDAGDTVVEFCVVHDVIGDSDLIDCNRSSDPPARIAYNLLYNTADDGIDADGGAVFAEGNVIHHCADQAISLVGAGSSTVIGNVCYSNGNGLSVKDSHVVFAAFNTFALNTVTGVRAIERTPGRGGGIITLRNSIVWGNAAQLLVEADGVIDVAFCDVEGAPVPGPGNLNRDPLFVDAAAADFHLQGLSPCIGAADDGGDLGALPYELVPREPTALLVVPFSEDSMSISWADNSSAETGFEIERAAGAAGFLPLVTLPADTLSFIDEGLTAEVTYRYRVRAFNDAGFSAFAGPVEGRIHLAPPEISGIEPAQGPSAGGTGVVIRGRNFHGALTATLGGAPLADLVVAASDEIHAVTRTGVRGTADLAIATELGEATLAGAFTYYDLYQRGDANGDGGLDLADVLSILDFLFQGGSAPACVDVADANRDAQVDLGDAVQLLFHLFAEGTAPDPSDARCY